VRLLRCEGEADRCLAHVKRKLLACPREHIAVISMISSTSLVVPDLLAPIHVNVVYIHRFAACSACLGLCWLQRLRAGADDIVRSNPRAVLGASSMAGIAVEGLACPEEVAGGRGWGCRRGQRVSMHRRSGVGSGLRAGHSIMLGNR